MRGAARSAGCPYSEARVNGSFLVPPLGPLLLQYPPERPVPSRAPPGPAAHRSSDYVFDLPSLLLTPPHDPPPLRRPALSRPAYDVPA